MILEKYEGKEFVVDEGLWEIQELNFKENLKEFKKEHPNNYIVIFTAFTPIDLVKFIYEELEATGRLEEQQWPLTIDLKWINNHYKNFTVHIAIVDEEEREMADGKIIVMPTFICEESNW